MCAEPTSWRHVADCLVWYAVFKGVITPLVAIASGTVWGPAVFVGSAFAIASVVFGDLFFTDDTDAVL